jgi:hypothetical protein
MINCFENPSASDIRARQIILIISPEMLIYQRWKREEKFKKMNKINFFVENCGNLYHNPRMIARNKFTSAKLSAQNSLYIILFAILAPVHFDEENMRKILFPGVRVRTGK